MLLSDTRKFYQRKRTVVLIILLIMGAILYFSFFHTVTINPLTEKTAVEKLEANKTRYALAPFTTDGCSGNISKSWNKAIKQFAKLSDTFADHYSNTLRIPFEETCIKHDHTYHTGEGGYQARLLADMTLRDDIINYALSNTETIKLRTGLATNEEVLFLYELIAESIYHSVRLGGAPCTGMSYAWGYGYNNGTCE